MENQQLEGLVESALRHVKILEEVDFIDIVISIKSSNVKMMIDAYRLMSETCDYPLHLGVTESGTIFRGTIKSSIGIGTLLAEGIGDTIRVSLNSDPIEEIKVAKEMLIALGLRESRNAIYILSYLWKNSNKPYKNCRRS